MSDKYKKLPTLAQLGKRPAFWVYIVCSDCIEPRITTPDNTLWSYGLQSGWAFYRKGVGISWHSYALKNYEFAGWL